eukprot:EG_transcript_4365
MAPPTVVVWLRKALRLHDNAALAAAVAWAAGCGGTVVPLFCLDPHFVRAGNVGPLRWRFLAEALADLHTQLQRYNSRLLVVRGSAVDAVPLACQQFGAQALYFEKDTERFARQRDVAVETAAVAAGVRVEAFPGHTLYDMDWLLRQCGNRPPKTYQAFLALHRKVGPPVRPIEAPHAALARLPTPPADPSYDPPSLAELVSAEDLGALGPEVFPGGESEGLLRLQRYCQDEAAVCNFAKPEGDPTTILPYTTGLSPYLKFGCVSVRKFYWDVQAVYDKGKKHTEPPVSLHGQVLFREWFYLMSYTTPNWERMEGNPLCMQIPWDRDSELVAAWRDGRTGYPWIDAAMQQLKQIGWMHHLARHCVACFLTRGDLWQHWEEGAKVFEYHLLDADWALNVANWYWLSASAFFTQYFRIYSPITFGQKYDKEGKFVRHYLPVLKDMPAKYIYEPWKAPIAVQRNARCVVGVDYPRPIVDHAKARDLNLQRMKAAYEAAKAPLAPLAPPVATSPPSSSALPGTGRRRPSAASAPITAFLKRAGPAEDAGAEPEGGGAGVPPPAPEPSGSRWAEAPEAPKVKRGRASRVQHR